MQGATGVADFDALQAELALGRSERMVYFAFDLLYLDGFDLRNAPLIEHKRVLAALLEEAKSESFHLARHLEVAPALVFEQACTVGL
jgi:bifunctional non-homologous end joining protein LigD